MRKDKRDLVAYVQADDESFYEEYLSRLTEEEYERFLEETPEFFDRKNNPVTE